MKTPEPMLRDPYGRPRIRRVLASDIDGLPDGWMWLCKCPRKSGFGSTPRNAYSDWRNIGGRRQ